MSSYTNVWYNSQNPPLASGQWTNWGNVFDKNNQTYATCANTTDYIEYVVERPELPITSIIVFGQAFEFRSSWYTYWCYSNIKVYSVDENGKETFLGNTIGATTTNPFIATLDLPNIKATKLRFRLKGDSYVNQGARTLEIIIKSQYFSNLPNSKLLKTKERKYYKYQYENWGQPILTSDNSSGNLRLIPTSVYSTTTYPAYKAFDGDDSTAWLTANGVISGDLLAIFDYKLKISSITVKGWLSGNYHTQSVTLLDEDNNVIGETHTYSGNESYTWNFDTPLILDKIKFRAVGNSAYAEIAEITINAQRQIIVDGTENDYDFYEDVDVYKAYYYNKRIYYKYSSVPTITPVFDSEIESTLGKNEVKMLTSPNLYLITMPNTITISTNQLITFDVGESSRGINNVGYIGVVASSAYPGFVMKNVECSEDNVNWTTITSSFGGRGDYLTNPLTIPQPNNYRYLRFTSGVDDTGYSIGGIYNFKINYNKYTAVISDQSDYDFYEDVKLHKTFNI